MIKSAKHLERLFSSLESENDPDLSSLPRINAYRAHFDLDPIATEEFETEIHASPEPEVNTEYVEIKFDDDNEEEVVEDTLGEDQEEDTSLIIQDEHFEMDGDVYVEQLEEESEVIEYLSEDYQPSLVSPKAKNQKPSQKRTEDEKLFTFRCHLCDTGEFPSMKLLAEHCKEFHTSLPQVACCSDDCSAVLSTWRRLMIHKEKHFPNDDQLRCRLCKKVYITAAGLEKHIEKHSIPLICSQCGKRFKDPKSLRWHEETHVKSLEERRNHKCSYDECGLKFITKQACENHIAMKHERIISCLCIYPNCGKSFYTRKAYNEHLRNTHSERRFCCEHCNFKAKTKSALRTHKDIHFKEESYLCDICDAAFSAYRRLKAHMICHSDVSPFQCQTCNASFKRSKDLKVHGYIHTKE